MGFLDRLRRKKEDAKEKRQKSKATEKSGIKREERALGLRKKLSPSIFQDNPAKKVAINTAGLQHDSAKEVIINTANKGSFDHNPLLATLHQVVCPACRFMQNIMSLDYLKSGRFFFGTTQRIGVAYAGPAIGAISMVGASNAVESITPIVIEIGCERCGAKMSYNPVSLEYLLFAATKQQKPENMYV